MELEENKEPKRSAFSVGELAIEPSDLKSGGKLELLKLLRIFLAKDQKGLSEGVEVRRSHFLLIKECLAL